jgi:predicted AlkP superfamily phosphohydrolase/phosphomutase
LAPASSGENVDWSRTRAYAMGLGQIYFNLRGREGKGIVSPGAEAKQLAEELSAKTSHVEGSGRWLTESFGGYKRDEV